jgi:hypothetical protein
MPLGVKLSFNMHELRGYTTYVPPARANMSESLYKMQLLRGHIIYA